MRASALFVAFFLIVSAGFAKDKKKAILPPYVLTAQTVTVIIDPEAGISVDNPHANQTAQKDVETAILRWGRFNPILSTQSADLIIVVRKGNGRLFDQTMPDPRQNNRPGSITQTDDSMSVGAQHGPQPNLSSGPSAAPTATPSQTEIGTTYDSFTVYEGHVKNPLDGPPAWRYIATDALHSHEVPAVDQFRKAIAEAEKAAAASKKP
jgi:hypothetical protein